MFGDDEEWTDEEIERFRNVTRCRHEWPVHGKSGYEPCSKCGYIGVREVTWEELGPERQQRVLAQLRGWKPTPDEILAGPVPTQGESALDLMVNLLRDEEES